MRRSLWALALMVPCVALAEGKVKKASAPAKKPPAAAKKAEATDPSTRPPPGVSWEEQVLRATGFGAPDLKATNPGQAKLGAERAAKADASRRLLEQAKVLPITAGRTVGDALTQDEVRGRVEDALKTYKVVGKRFFSDGGMELDVELPLAALTSAVVPAPEKPLALNTEGEAKYTGLIVDASGLGTRPVLAPRLLDATGKPLYGPESLSASARITQGVAAWAGTVDDAKKSPRAGDTPLVVKAERLQGSDLVLAGDDAKKLSETNTRFLADGRVVIVTR